MEHPKLIEILGAIRAMVPRFLLATEPRFGNPRAVQIRLPGFTHDGLVELGGKVRDLFVAGIKDSDRVRATVDDTYVGAGSIPRRKALVPATGNPRRRHRAGGLPNIDETLMNNALIPNMSETGSPPRD